MKKRLHYTFIILLPLFFIAGNSFAQFTLKIRVATAPKLHSTDRVFLAGNFNNWNPGDTAFVLSEKNGLLVKEIKNLPAGNYEFKFTRGAWEKGEVLASGGGVNNHAVQLTSDTMLTFIIGGWQDDFATAYVRKHTASTHVQVLDTAFTIPQLHTKRRIWIYLPEGYATSKKQYPVLYMHDGQNVFDEYTSGFGEWGVDECLDSLIAKGEPAAIVVGIDNGPKRMNEYNPYDFEKFGKGEGEMYTDFIAYTLKPFIDKHYRTKPSRENTIIAGSSMGGLISYYAILKHNAVFGKAGVFSPAFWTAPAIERLTDSVVNNITARVFFYMGGKEGDEMLKNMESIEGKLAANKKLKTDHVVDAEASHNEQAWRKWFPEFYRWIMGKQ